MFLHGLNEEECKVFLSLAHIAMKVDGDISEEELEVLDTYSHECLLPDFVPTDTNVDSLISKVSDINIIKRRVILLELIGIWIADNQLHPKEIEMMNYVGDKLGLGKSDIQSLKEWSSKLKSTIEEGYSILEGVSNGGA